MAVVETWFKQDLKNPVKVHHLNGNVFSMDNSGNLIGVEVLDNGQAASLSGSVTANIIRADGGTVTATGTLSGNKCSVVLPQAAYYVPGVMAIFIKLTSGGAVTTLCSVTAVCYRSSTDVAIDPGTIIPDINALIASINDAIASIPGDYDALAKDVKAINEVINGRKYNYKLQSASGWTEKILVPTFPLKAGDYITLDIDFDPTVDSSTYIYLKDGDTQISYNQVNGLSTKTVTYKATSDVNQFRVTTNSQSYTGTITATLTVSSRQTQVDENRITGRSLAGEKKGLFSLERYSPFVVGGYDYPDFNYNTIQVSSKNPMIADRPLFIELQNGFKAAALFIDGETVTSSGWQEKSIYIPSGSKFVLKIEKVSHGSDEQADVLEYLTGLKIIDDDGINWHDVKGYAEKWENSKTIAYSTGEVSSTSGYYELYYFPNPEFKYVKAHLSVYGRSTAEVAFYSTEEISTNGYMLSASQCAGSWDDDHYIYAEVPSGCKLMTINTRNVLDNNDPFIPEIYVDNDDQYKNVELDNRAFEMSLFQGFKYIYHFWVDNLGTSEIPSQSLADIDMAHRLGFKMFELNAHKTATAGKYVCMHGVSGKIGSELVARDGTDISNLAFGDVSASTFLNDYIYNTPVEQYQTHVTFLDEALILCKQYNMIPIVSWADYGAIEYIEKYVGSRYVLLIYDDYYIRRANFKGIYNLYQARTANQLKATLEKSGAPMLYSITSSSLSDSALAELRDICHKHKSFIGSAGVYQTPVFNKHLFDVGFDFMSSGWEVEYFDNGNIANYRSDSTFTGLSTDGTVSGGVLTLSNGKYAGIYPDNSAIKYISKGCLRIRYSGTLKFYLGAHISGVSIESDGSRDVVLTTAFFKANPCFDVVAVGSVSVYEIQYDASVC